VYYVYLLIDKGKKKYIGYSSNLRRRVKEHFKNKVYTSKRMNQLKLFYYEAYSDEEAAKERERKLKQYGSSYQGLLKRLKLKL
jgi:putative endonuclease